MKVTPHIKPQINCVIDARVSSDRQLDGYGLEDQEERCLRFVDDRGWHAIKVFCKSYSGRKQERKDFEIILQFIKECRKKGIPIQYYVIKSIDRFTRNGAATYWEMRRQLSELGGELVDTYGMIQQQQNTMQGYGLEFGWSMYSPTDSAQLFEAERAKSDVRDILTRMIGAEVQLVR